MGMIDIQDIELLPKTSPVDVVKLLLIVYSLCIMTML